MEMQANDIREASPGEFEASVLVSNELGIHARPAALVAKTAQQYSAQVLLHAAGQKVDAKSILDILSLAACKGTHLTIRSRGSDAKACVTAILDLVRKQFEEGGQ